MTLYTDETAIRDNAATIAGRAAKKKSRKVWALAAVGTVFAGGAAFAAVQLFGFGDASVAASTVQSLTVDNIDATAPLIPGSTVGAKGIVHNPNNFPVKVTGVIIRQTGLAGTGPGCQQATLHAQGTFADYGTGVGNGWKTILAAPVTIAAGGAEWVTLPAAVSQDSSATAMCGFDAKIAVTAEAGN